MATEAESGRPASAGSAAGGAPTAAPTAASAASSAAAPATALRGADALLDRLVSATSWLWLVLVAVIVGGVVLRTFFGISRIELEELQWHLHAVGFLIGIVGCAVFDRHVRVDVFREGMDERRRDWVDLYGLLLFQLPFFGLVLWSAIPLVVESFATGERSTSAGGLGERWLFKSALPIATGLLIATTLAAMRRVAARLFAVRVPDRGADRGADRAPDRGAPRS